ncbi:hypothetical protein V6N12_007871 [Hibiscus sabdariffa]|uniref:CCHC-type domain-containing protein n=1 Tax=Hibiscus sabdariffa TaxID=183260 RepID=A0ABR2F302_9ROSI
MQIASLVEARRQEDQGINFCSSMILWLCSDFCISGLVYWYALVVPVPKFLTGIRVSVLLDKYRLSFGMARPRKGVRGGGQAPVHLDEVEIEQGDDETLPPPPPREPSRLRWLECRGAAKPQGGGNGLPLERLRNLGGVEFKGLSPERSEAWLESTIRILGQMECTDARKLGCVVSLLQGDAYASWTTVTSSLEEGEITWKFFQSAFRKKYLGTRYEDEKKREFMALVQGSMSVSDYEVQFVRLSQYAFELVPTERDRCDQFRYGLVKEVKTYVLAYDYTDFDVLVARAKDIEQSLGLPTRASGSSVGKRSANWDRDSAKRHKDRRYQPEPRCGGGNPRRGHQGQGILHRAHECARCGRRHTGECWGNGSTCWNCGVRGHMRRDCPHPARDGQALVRAAEPQRGRGRGRGNF